MFTLLTDFVEHNAEKQTIAWDADEPHATAWKEMNELIRWYKEVYPNREAELDKERPEPRISFKKMMGHENDDDPEVIEYRKYLNLRMEVENQWVEEDEAMLIRAIKLRPFLWYA